MNRFARAVSLALTFTLGTGIALTGTLRGLGAWEVLFSTAIAMAAFYVVARLVAGWACRTVVRLLAEDRVERQRRRFLCR